MKTWDGQSQGWEHVRTPLSDIGPSSVNNAGSSNFSCGNKVSPYANVYVRRSKKGKGEASEVCGLSGFCNQLCQLGKASEERMLRLC